MDEQYELPPGAVTIAPGVLTTIVRMTTLAHPGPRLRGKGAQAEGLRVDVSDDDAVTVDVHVIADPSASLTDLGKELQTQIARALEDMVGMEVRSVNVFIDKIEFDAGGKGSS